FFFSSRRRHTRSTRDWSSDVCSSDLTEGPAPKAPALPGDLGPGCSDRLELLEPLLDHHRADRPTTSDPARVDESEGREHTQHDPATIISQPAYRAIVAAVHHPHGLSMIDRRV